MLVLKLEVWPGGKDTRKINLGSVHVENDETGTDTEGNYTVTFFPPEGGWSSKGCVERFARLPGTAWALAVEALRQLVPRM